MIRSNPIICSHGIKTVEDWIVPLFDIASAILLCSSDSIAPKGIVVVRFFQLVVVPEVCSKVGIPWTGQLP